jgi:hypothetical protein
MNWIAVGAVAESIGVIAIIVSLAYVAMQIRQNTEQIALSVKATELTAFEHNIESGNNIRELLIVNPDIAKLFLRGMHSFHALEGDEKFRFGLLLRNLFSSAQGAYIRQISVNHDPRHVEGLADVIDSMLVNRGVQEWLKESRPDWRPEFREFVDERLQIALQKTSQSED